MDYVENVKHFSFKNDDAVKVDADFDIGILTLEELGDKVMVCFEDIPELLVILQQVVAVDAVNQKFIKTENAQ